MQNYFPTAPFQGKLVHLGVSGSISAFKALELLRAFYKAGIRVSVTLTEAAAQFVTPLCFRSLGAEVVYTSMFPATGADLDENFNPFGHLSPGAEADAFVIAPASATTIHRLARGSAEEILSAQALAYPRSILIAPAMNPRMWTNPATKENCMMLKRHGYVILHPGSGEMACGDEGIGKLADLRFIYLEVLKALSPQDLAGQKVMLTLGPTRENWDGVRFWTNHSTGTMGASLAIAAYLRGADVHAVCGPGSPWLPPEIHRYDVTGAREMFTVSKGLWTEMNMGIFTAAVADFSPESHGLSKFKKTEAMDGFTLKFVPNPDILATLGKEKQPGQKIIGFAAETDNLEESIKKKLVSKNADLIVGNKIGVPDSGFGSSMNTAILHDVSGRLESLPALPKPDLAWRIIDWLLTL